MPITLEQKKQLTDQIANNLTGDLIKIAKTTSFDTDRHGSPRYGIKCYMGNIYPILVATQDIKIIFNIDNQEVFTLNECNCEECGRYQFINGRQNDYRKIIETNIVNHIVKETLNKTEQINLICVGSDWAGLSVILANLYKLGYINFFITNIEQNQDKYNRNMAHLEQETNNDPCLQFWREIFLGSNIQCTTIGVDMKHVDLSQYANNFITAAKLIVFAEDLGNTGNIVKDIANRALIHNNCVNKVVDAIKKIKTEHIFGGAHKIFIVKFNGQIIENNYKENSSNKKSFGGLRKGFLL